MKRIMRGDPNKVAQRLATGPHERGSLIPVTDINPAEELPQPALVLEGGSRGYVQLDGLRMTRKQFLFAHEYVKSLGNATQSASKVYDCESYNSAKSIGSQILHQPNVNALIQRILRQKDIVRKITDNWVDWVDATKTTYWDGFAVGTDPDWKARGEGIKTFLKLTGSEAPPQERVKGKGDIIEITVDDFEEEPIEVTHFIAREGRYPTAVERNKLLSSPELPKDTKIGDNVDGTD